MTSDMLGLSEVADSRARDLIAQVENLPVEERKQTLARMFKATVEGGSFTLFDLFLRAQVRFAKEELVRAHEDQLRSAQAKVHALESLQQDMFQGEAEEAIRQTMSYLEVSPFSIIQRDKEGQVPFARR